MATGGNINQRLKELGIDIPDAETPIATYAHTRTVGNLVYVAGQGAEVHGKIGRDFTVKEGYDAARSSGIAVLSQLKHALNGDLSRVKQCVELLCYVHCTDEFTEQHLVMDGCSDLFRDIFGEAGLGVRTIMGNSSFAVNYACGIVATFEIKS